MSKVNVKAIEQALEINATVDSAIAYAHDVVDGRRIECEYIQWSAKRFIDDLDTQDERGLRFMPPMAEKVLTFFPMFCVHVEGELAGKPIYLEDWQAFFLVQLFGWYRYDFDDERWVRRFNMLYLEVARKNAKSMLLSGIAIYMLAFDGEEGAQIYTAATKKDQAKIVFDASAQMVKKSPALQKVIKVHKTHLEVVSNFSRCRPLSRDADSMDGLNSHCNIIDELHAHPKRELFDVLVDGTLARVQPITAVITTAGSNKEGICYDQRKIGLDVLNPDLPQAQDDSYLVVVYTLDEHDDPYDEKNWPKANPNLGKSKKITLLRTLAARAKLSALARLNFLIKQLNVWSDAAISWIDTAKWAELGGDMPSNLNTLPFWTGVDYAPVYDVTAKINLYADNENQHYYIKCSFYYPEESVASLPNDLQSKFKRWAGNGYLQLLPGSMLKTEVLEHEILQDMGAENNQEVCLDPWNTYQLTAKLYDAGKDAVHVGQTVRNFTEAMKFIDGLILEKQITHDGNPMMAWMMGNVEVKPDLNDNIFPRKAGKKKENKIDGPTALFTAMNRAMINASTFDAFSNINPEDLY